MAEQRRRAGHRVGIRHKEGNERAKLMDSNGGRYRIRTCDFYRVRIALYR